MPNLKDIKSRIQTTKNTQQITKAMKLVSAAKLRRAQQRIQNMRPYARTLLSVIADIAASGKVENKLMMPVENPQKLLVVVLTSDRGLCGAFNNAVIRYAEQYHNEIKNKYEKIDYIFVGKRGEQYFASRNVNTQDVIYNLAKDVCFNLAKSVAEKILKQFEGGEYDEVRIVYNEFKSAIQQDVVAETLLPVDVSKSTLSDDSQATGFSKDMIYEPDLSVIIDELLDNHFSMQMYRVMSESVASEHGARMTAMENSTNNAGELINSLTLTYNNLRQAAITTELIEITSGAEALNG